jgi:hypothetical protein
MGEKYENLQKNKPGSAIAYAFDYRKSQEDES